MIASSLSYITYLLLVQRPMPPAPGDRTPGPPGGSIDEGIIILLAFALILGIFQAYKLSKRLAK